MGSDWTDDKPVYPTAAGFAIGRAELARQAAVAAGVGVSPEPGWTDEQLQRRVSDAAFERAGQAVISAEDARAKADTAIDTARLAHALATQAIGAVRYVALATVVALVIGLVLMLGVLL